MSWRQRIVCAGLLFAATASAGDQDLWREFGLSGTQALKEGAHTVTAYRMKDLTGAVAAWEWQRTMDDAPCDVTALCAQNHARTLLSEENYVLVITGAPPTRAELDAALAALPGKHDSSLPPILTFIPRAGLVPNSSRYILGPESLRAFAPELSGAKPGFDEGAEAQVADYEVSDGTGQKSRARLALFYYPTPEMARAHAQQFKILPDVHLKRSNVLIAMVLKGASDISADTLLSRIEYEAHITLNEEPPPSPIKPLYRLLLNIIYMSIGLSLLGLFGGLVYGGMRLYRHRYGTLEAQEAMTTLRLTGE
jgi:hypothetical protein